MNLGQDVRMSRERQDQVLVALHEVSLDRVRLMKTLFLVWYRAGRPDSGPFDFQPYLYGPCAFDLYGALDLLEALGLVARLPHPVASRAPYHLTRPNGVAAAAEAERRLEPGVSRQIRDTARWAAGLGFNVLLGQVYREAPEYAVRSVVAQAR